MRLGRLKGRAWGSEGFGKSSTMSILKGGNENTEIGRVMAGSPYRLILEFQQVVGVAFFIFA